MQLFKPVHSGIVPFLILRLYRKNCVSGLLISSNTTNTKLTPGAVIFCDASDYAFGGYRIKLNDQPLSGMFSRFKYQQSSTFRELKPFSMLSMRMLHLSGTRRLKFLRITRMHLGLFWLAAQSSIFSV